MRIRNLFENKIEPHESIDTLPIYNWNKINETNDLQWLLRKKVETSDYQKQVLGQLWDKILCEFIDVFGIPEKMKEILELKREIFVLKCQVQLEKNPILENFIRVAEFKLKKLIESDKVKSVGQAKVYVEKYLGFKLNEKETSVKEFYEYIGALQAQVKQNLKVNGQ